MPLTSHSTKGTLIPCFNSAVALFSPIWNTNQYTSTITTGWTIAHTTPK